MTDYYRVLQVSRDADPEVIERAYKALSLKYHPDRAPSHERARANRRMQEINRAHSVLRDPVQRAAYDQTLPSEEGRAWDAFWERGLLGMFLDRYGSRTGTRR